MIAWPEILIISAVFLILLLYHIYLVYQVKTHPLTTSLGLTHHLRQEWVEEVKRELHFAQAQSLSDQPTPHLGLGPPLRRKGVVDA